MKEVHVPVGWCAWRAAGLVSVALALASTAPAQEPAPGEPRADTVARVRGGGGFEQTRWRRRDDGQFEVDYIAAAGGNVVEAVRWQPLFGRDFERGLTRAGWLDVLLLACHGRGDLLSMTDAELHFERLGADRTNVALRQRLLEPLPRGAGRDVELLDRKLAIELLVGRGCREVEAELRGLARGGEPALAERARWVLARSFGVGERPVRRRLDQETTRLPERHDLAIVVAHERLPELAWLTALRRRYRALQLADTIASAGRGTVSDAMRNGCQVTCDVLGARPLGLVQAYGNARLDHSCVVLRLDEAVAVTWQAAGEIDAEGWGDARLSQYVREGEPLFGSTLAVQPDGLTAATAGAELGRTNPPLAASLLRDVGAAVRVVLPADSRCWQPSIARGLPAPVDGELRVTFGERIELHAIVTTASEADAARWTKAAGEELAAAVDALEGAMPDAFREVEPCVGALQELRAARVSVDGVVVTARAALTGVTPEAVRDAVERVWVR